MKMHNPKGQIETCEICWSQDELDVFKGLRVPKEKRESTYLVAYFSCWFCVFALLETRDRIIHPEAFGTASMIASKCTFSLAVPVLVSLHPGLNGIAYYFKTHNVLVSLYHSQSFSRATIFMSGLPIYFRTHNVLQPTPLGPPMVRYSSSLTK